MDRKKGLDTHFEVVTDPAKLKLKRPPMYQVVLINDDYTPMDFVVEVLMQFFSLDEPTATQVMLNVHQKGKGICGIYTRDVAEAKVKQVNNYSKNCEFPLMCEMEKCEA